VGRSPPWRAPTPRPTPQRDLEPHTKAACYARRLAPSTERERATVSHAAAVDQCARDLFARTNDTVPREVKGVVAGAFQNERPRRPATERSEGAQLGAPPE
jgi:hypothetical protein